MPTFQSPTFQTAYMQSFTCHPSPQMGNHAPFQGPATTMTRHAAHDIANALNPNCYKQLGPDLTEMLTNQYLSNKIQFHLQDTKLHHPIDVSVIACLAKLFFKKPTPGFNEVNSKITRIREQDRQYLDFKIHNCIKSIVKSILKGNLDPLYEIAPGMEVMGIKITNLIKDLSRNSVIQQKCNATIQKLYEINQERTRKLLSQPLSIAVNSLCVAIKTDQLSQTLSTLMLHQEFDRKQNPNFNENHWNGLFKAFTAICSIKTINTPPFDIEPQKLVYNIKRSIRKITEEEQPIYDLVLLNFITTLSAPSQR